MRAPTSPRWGRAPATARQQWLRRQPRPYDESVGRGLARRNAEGERVFFELSERGTRAQERDFGNREARGDGASAAAAIETLSGEVLDHDVSRQVDTRHYIRRITLDEQRVDFEVRFE